MRDASRSLKVLAPLATLLALAGCGAAPPVGPSAQEVPLAAAAAAASAATSEGGAAKARSGKTIVTQISLARDTVERESDLSVSVLIENRGSEPIKLLAEETTSPVALFEIRNHLGERVTPTSPPVPGTTERVIPPGRALAIKMTLAGMFSPPLAPGEYTIRLRRIDSSPHLFRVTGPR